MYLIYNVVSTTQSNCVSYRIDAIVLHSRKISWGLVTSHYWQLNNDQRSCCHVIRYVLSVVLMFHVSWVGAFVRSCPLWKRRGQHCTSAAPMYKNMYICLYMYLSTYVWKVPVNTIKHWTLQIKSWLTYTGRNPYVCQSVFMLLSWRWVRLTARP